MDTKIIEILNRILDGIAENKTLEDLEKELKSSKGFDESHVATAYSWIYDKLLANSLKKKPSTGTKSLRVFSEEETEVIGRENYDRLLKLVKAGFLTEEDLNLILDELHILQSEDISKDEINLLVLTSLFDIDQNLLPGNRTLLYLSDKIN